MVSNHWGAWERLVSIRLLRDPATGQDYSEEVWVGWGGKTHTIRQERKREYVRRGT
ncbi:hypothetical protein CPT_Palo_026 [Rhizobium phage Palo]|uniref:Uncharacterized protein n=1 Tax=Rhizobium phage Palo TaxID=2767573 RepID=A0A7L8G4J7_9CAUD|nr:hypothetical protein CPT_Palo_026 [Rhizobium phage Palo]